LQVNSFAGANALSYQLLGTGASQANVSEFRAVLASGLTVTQAHDKLLQDDLRNHVPGSRHRKNGQDSTVGGTDRERGHAAEAVGRLAAMPRSGLKPSGPRLASAPQR